MVTITLALTECQLQMENRYVSNICDHSTDAEFPTSIRSHSGTSTTAPSLVARLFRPAFICTTFTASHPLSQHAID